MTRFVWTYIIVVLAAFALTVQISATTTDAANPNQHNTRRSLNQWVDENCPGEEGGCQKGKGKVAWERWLCDCTPHKGIQLYLHDATFYNLTSEACCYRKCLTMGSDCAGYTYYADKDMYQCATVPAVADLTTEVPDAVSVCCDGCPFNKSPA